VRRVRCVTRAGEADNEYQRRDSGAAAHASAIGDLLAARTAAGDLPHVGLDEAAALLILIAREDPEKLDAAAVRFLGRACLERSFITLADAQFVAACLAQLERGDEEARASFAGALRRLRLERAAQRIGLG
jgi:hypothetical protein